MPNMHLLILISGIVLLPQALTLTCNDCDLRLDCSKPKKLCSADQNRCGLIRVINYKGGAISENVYGECLKEDECSHGIFNRGPDLDAFTTKCCSTDSCNNNLPDPYSITPSPNGLKCYRCNEKSKNCNATLNCNADQTFCATLTEGEMTVKGCATRSLCVNPLPKLPLSMRKLTCCEGNYCNSSGSSTGACLLLLASTLAALFFSNRMLQ